MAEPEENTYVITVVLRDIRKRDAVEFAGNIRDGANYYVHHDNIEVFTAHLKDEITS